MAKLTIIRNFLAKLAAGRTDDGIMITLPNPKTIDLQESVMMDLLLSNGVDPRLIKSEEQLKNILNQLEAVNKQKLQAESGIRNTRSAKVFDLEGKQIPQGSKIMGGKATETEAEIAERLTKGNKQSVQKLRMQKMLDDAIEDASPGFANDVKVDAELVAENLAERMGKVYDDLPTKERLDLYDQAYTGLSKQRFKNMRKPDDDPEDLATGGRVGLKAGMSRRAFLALMGSAGAGIGAAKTGLLKLFGKGAGKQVTKEIIKTPPVPGKPEWFDNLVNKVILEGDDVTKKLSVQDRQVVHSLKIDDMDDVTVYRNLDDGQIRVSYDSPNNMGEQPVELVFKPGMADETTKGKPADEFYAVEAEPRGVRTGPDDYEIEFDGENLASNVDELISDTSKLKQIATNKKPTMQEFVTSKNKKDQTRTLNEDQLEQAEYLETKYGPGPESPEEFASGGIARMLGE